jgi:hypothetical protein
MPAYSEGTVFLVPLKNGGYCRGVVARTGPEGQVLFGYFFGPRLISAGNAERGDLEPSQAILRARFGDLGLINSEWQILGSVPQWRRTQWPIPDFVRRDLLGRKKPVRVRYADDNPSRIESETPVQEEEVAGLAADSMSGYGAIEIKLTKLLGSG